MCSIEAERRFIMLAVRLTTEARYLFPLATTSASERLAWLTACALVEWYEASDRQKAQAIERYIHLGFSPNDCVTPIMCDLVGMAIGEVNPQKVNQAFSYMLGGWIKRALQVADDVAIADMLF
jgi:hypothetical protein